MITTVTVGYYDGLGTVRAGRFGRTDGTDGRRRAESRLLVSFGSATGELAGCLGLTRSTFTYIPYITSHVSIHNHMYPCIDYRRTDGLNQRPSPRAIRPVPSAPHGPHGVRK